MHETAPLDPLPHQPPPFNPAALTQSSTSTTSLFAPPPPLPSSTATPYSSPLPTSTSAALSLLKQTTTPSTGIYVLARLHSRTYLLHPRDILTLPTLRPLQAPGTSLALTRILEVGSREYAIRSPAASASQLVRKLDRDEVKALETIPPYVARCDLTVLEHTRSPMEEKFKKKPKKGYEKTIKAKHGWTRLRVGDVWLGDGLPVETGAVSRLVVAAGGAGEVGDGKEGEQTAEEVEKENGEELVDATGGAPESEEGVGSVPT